jgi:hypothetical protein
MVSCIKLSFPKVHRKEDGRITSVNDIKHQKVFQAFKPINTKVSAIKIDFILTKISEDID